MLKILCTLDSKFNPARDFLTAKLWPLFDLTIRVVIGSIFFKSGYLKLQDFLNGNFANQVSLFKDTYMVPILMPDVAAFMAMSAEVFFSVLLILGFATRFAALGLLGVTAVIISVFPDVTEHFFWLLLLGVLFTRGAGPLSLDVWLCRNK